MTSGRFLPWVGRLLVVLVALGLAALPLAAAHDASSSSAPLPFTNGQETSFGRIAMPPYLGSGQTRQPVAVEFRLRDEGTIRDAQFLMFAFNLHAETAHVELDRLETPRGAAIAISRDERAGATLQPRVFVTPANLSGARTPNGTDLVLRGHTWADRPGQFHVGAMAIAFAHDWTTLQTPAGDPAQLYAFTFLSVENPPGRQPGPPFQGEGNPGGAMLLLGGAGFLTLTLIAMAAWTRRKRPQEPSENTRTDDPPWPE